MHLCHLSGIDIDIDLDAEMDVTDFKTQAYKPQENWKNMAFEAFSYLCPEGSPEAFYYQNQGIPLCKCGRVLPVWKQVDKLSSLLTYADMQT